jgi:ribosomal protein L37AE/L43A
VSVTTCPNCGAPVAAGIWTCRYCHVSVDPAHTTVPSLAQVAGVIESSGSSLERALPGLVASLDAR